MSFSVTFLFAPVNWHVFLLPSYYIFFLVLDVMLSLSLLAGSWKAACLGVCLSAPNTDRQPSRQSELCGSGKGPWHHQHRTKNPSWKPRPMDAGCACKGGSFQSAKLQVLGMGFVCLQVRKVKRVANLSAAKSEDSTSVSSVHLANA